MKARRFLLAAVLSVVGCAFAFAGCGETADDDHEHTYDWEIVTPATCQQEGERKGKCTICGKETEETIPRSAHTLDGETTVITPSTCLKKGSGTRKCSVCGTEQPVELDYAPHEMTHHDAVEGDCNKDGAIEYWSCSVCGRNFSDEQGTTDAVVTIPKENYPHHFDEKGLCTVCGARSSDVTEHICIPIKVNAVPSDCKTAGVKEHYECRECGKVYLDAEGTQLTTKEALALPLSEDHNAAANAVYYDEIEARDCLHYGKKARWDCKVCGRHFKDENLTEEFEPLGEDGVCTQDTLENPKSEAHRDAKGEGTWAYHPKSDATCSSVGWTEDVYVCNVCGEIFRCKEFDDNLDKLKTDEKTGETYKPLDPKVVTIPINPSNHANAHSHLASKAPSKCGIKEATYKTTCYKCDDCEKYFSDQGCTMEITKDEALYFGQHGTMKEENATDSTCQTNGHPHCWECGSCGEHFDTATPAPETVCLSDAEYNLPLVPHAYTRIKSNSKGHWYYCQYCGINEMDEDGVLMMEDHVREDGQIECDVCGFGDFDLTKYFTIDFAADYSYATITGFAKDTDGEFLLNKSNETILTIPDATNNDVPITEIAPYAFSSDDPHPENLKAWENIEEVYIPASIVKIGEGAFMHSFKETKAKVVEFESSMEYVEIGAQAFCHLSSLKRITLPKRLKNFSSGMLARCLSLTTVKMPEEIEESIVELDQLFSQCSSLQTVDLWCLDGKSSYSLGKQTFWLCSSLTTLYLPKGLSSIGGACMAGCTSIEKIYFGGSEEEWTAVQKADTTTNLDAWNYNTAVLKGKDLIADGVVVCGHTH